MKYVKTADDPQFWYVLNGQRMAVNSPEEMYSFGLLPVETVTAVELEAIPLLGSDMAEDEEE